MKSFNAPMRRLSTSVRRTPFNEILELKIYILPYWQASTPRPSQSSFTYRFRSFVPTWITTIGVPFIQNWNCSVL